MGATWRQTTLNKTDQSVYSNANITCTRCMQYFAIESRHRRGVDNSLNGLYWLLSCGDHVSCGISCTSFYHRFVAIITLSCIVSQIQQLAEKNPKCFILQITCKTSLLTINPSAFQNVPINFETRKPWCCKKTAWCRILSSFPHPTPFGGGRGQKGARAPAPGGTVHGATFGWANVYEFWNNM